MRAPFANKSRTEQGFFTIWTLGLCVMLLGIGGIGLDLWRGLTDRRELASITDAAAIVGASQIDVEAFKEDSDNPQLDAAKAQQAANTYLTQEAAKAGIEFDGAPIVNVQGNTVNIQASTDVQLTLMKLFAPGESLKLTTRSSSSPETAQ